MVCVLGCMLFVLIWFSTPTTVSKKAQSDIKQRKTSNALLTRLLTNVMQTYLHTQPYLAKERRACSADNASQNKQVHNKNMQESYRDKCIYDLILLFNHQNTSQ